MRVLAVLILLPVLMAETTSSCATVAEEKMTADRELYRLSSDVRIKRMHLMRPDLISYPNLQDYYA